jgi:hypothetical protein
MTEKKKKPKKANEKASMGRSSKRLLPDNLIPLYRIEKALRGRINRPLTKEYIATVHGVVEVFAEYLAVKIMVHSEYTFRARNVWLEEANRDKKTRMDAGVLSDLYYEVGERDTAKIEQIRDLVNELEDSIGFLKTQDALGMVLYGMPIAEALESEAEAES